jgi:hypothetical protein
MKNWSTQPDEIAEWPVLTSFWVKGSERGVSIEVRMGPNAGKINKSFYITHGNLFGSQTVHAEDGDAAFRIIGQIVDAANKMKESDKPLSVPKGCKLLANANQ